MKTDEKSSSERATRAKRNKWILITERRRHIEGQRERRWSGVIEVRSAVENI